PIKRRAGYWILDRAFSPLAQDRPETQGLKPLAIIERALGPKDEKAFALENLPVRFFKLTSPHLCRVARENQAWKKLDKKGRLLDIQSLVPEGGGIVVCPSADRALLNALRCKWEPGPYGRGVP
ncbi:MAG: hypothetical protein ACOC54_05270, partial [Candidatus Sumerlaeota bacterium]